MNFEVQFTFGSPHQHTVYRLFNLLLYLIPQLFCLDSTISTRKLGLRLKFYNSWSSFWTFGTSWTATPLRYRKLIESWPEPLLQMIGGKTALRCPIDRRQRAQLVPWEELMANIRD